MEVLDVKKLDVNARATSCIGEARHTCTLPKPSAEKCAMRPLAEQRVRCVHLLLVNALPQATCMPAGSAAGCCGMSGGGKRPPAWLEWRPQTKHLTSPSAGSLNQSHNQYLKDTHGHAHSESCSYVVSHMHMCTMRQVSAMMATAAAVASVCVQLVRP